MNLDSAQTRQLLNAIRQGDAHALPAVFEQYRLRLEQLLALRMDRRLAARVDLADVLQEVYLDAGRQITAYLENPVVGVYVWLRGIALQRLLKVHRFHLGAKRRSISREVQMLHDGAENPEALAAKGSSPSHALRRKELRHLVQESLDQLKLDDQEIILMRDFEGISNSEAAQVLGISETAATMRYGRALFRLKEKLTAILPVGESFP